MQTLAVDNKNMHFRPHNTWQDLWKIYGYCPADLQILFAVGVEEGEVVRWLPSPKRQPYNCT